MGSAVSLNALMVFTALGSNVASVIMRLSVERCVSLNVKTAESLRVMAVVVARVTHGGNVVRIADQIACTDTSAKNMLDAFVGIAVLVGICVTSQDRNWDPCVRTTAPGIGIRDVAFAPSRTTDQTAKKSASTQETTA